MAIKSITSYHCEVCQKETRHIKVPLDDVMREIADTGVKKAVVKVKSLMGVTNREAYRCTKCRSYLIPHMGKEHRYAIGHDFQPWDAVKRNPKMLREVREKYYPNA